ncbi:MAG: HNH endonuclease [bacterium]
MDQKLHLSVARLSNDELLARVKHLAEREREATSSLIAHLAELDQRRLYLAQGYSSLFSYCTQVLHIAESAAYRRIEAARTVHRFPVILEMLEQGSVNLTTVILLGAHLTQENHRKVLEEARHKSKRQVEELCAKLHPQPAIPSCIRKLPTATTSVASRTRDEAAVSHQFIGGRQPTESVALPSPAFVQPQPRPAVVVPLAPERYKVQFTASAETYEKLRRAQNLLRHEIPNGDPAAIFDRALTVLLQDLAKSKFAAADRPRKGGGYASGSRHIPAEVKRAVWLRDGGRCTFVGLNGRRCTEEGFLEFHHVTPYAAGGPATGDNIQLRCRAHNEYEAELDFGPHNPLVREQRACYAFAEMHAKIQQDGGRSSAW